ncbi:MAG: potassium-transporting ATPase subunit KdpA [Caldisericia bacterium]|nr:potassium-transporting ATPase subunit KdpA [Caldisericia bacterium]
MAIADLIFFLLFTGVLFFCAWFVGGYLGNVFGGGKIGLLSFLAPVEKALYRFFGVKPDAETDWKSYAKSFVVFTLFGVGLLFAIQLCQGFLPFNPQGFGAVRWDSALNTAVSFATNTNWQPLAGEASMSHFTQMVGMTVQNFLSAAAGIAVCAALMRAFKRKSTEFIGNFWVDLTRAVLYVLLPLSILFSIIFAGLGVVQTLAGAVPVGNLQGGSQVLPLGPVASQLAIKLIGSNGGGFFGANSAHPFENPRLATNIISLLLILLIPASLPFAFGKILGDKKKGVAIFLVMLIMFAVGLGIVYTSETSTSQKLHMASNASMYGKEVRFGTGTSALWSQATTATSNGSVNSMHDMMNPFSNLVQIFNMVIGEVIFGGVGVGLIGMILYMVLTMFIAGLMIGRTPELIGKKLQVTEMWMAVIALMGPAVVTLLMAGVFLLAKANIGSPNPDGSRAITEILYANASLVGNNGSACGGFAANTMFVNLSGSFGMLLGRLATIIPAIALAGSLAKKKISPKSVATIDIASPAFMFMLIFIIVIVGALTFFPALLLGPVLEGMRLGM